MSQDVQSWGNASYVCSIYRLNEPENKGFLVEAICTSTNTDRAYLMLDNLNGLGDVELRGPMLQKYQDHCLQAIDEDDELLGPSGNFSTLKELKFEHSIDKWFELFLIGNLYKWVESDSRARQGAGYRQQA